MNLLSFKWKRDGYRSQFDSSHVNTCFRMWCRHSTVPFNFICVTDDPAGLDSAIQPVELWPEPVPGYGGGNAPNCFRRLRMFSKELSELFGPHWIWTDLDCLVTGNVDHILLDDSDLKIWRPDGGRSKCNGSLVSHNAGTRQYLWDTFNPESIGSVETFRAQTRHLGSDQAWIAQQLTPADRFFESLDGVYAFRALRNSFRERQLGKLQKLVTRKRNGLMPAARERDAARRERRHTRLDAREQERMETKLPSNCALVYFPGQWHPWDREIQRTYPWVEEHYR